MDATQQELLENIAGFINNFPGIGGVTRVIDIPITTDTAAYASGDVIDSVKDINDSIRKAKGSAVIQSVAIVDADDNQADVDIYFFSETFTAQADNAAWTPSFEDLQKYVGKASIEAADYDTDGTSAFAFKTNLGIPVSVPGQIAKISVLIIARGAATFTATSDRLFLRLGLLQD